jgi:hypothetical protein
MVVGRDFRLIPDFFVLVLGCQRMTRCQNCDTSLEHTYCPNCGQKDVDLERPMGALIGQLLKETFDIDGRAFRTIRALFRQPGFLTSEYLAGRRRSYTAPIRLYLVVSVSFFVLVAWLASQGILLTPELHSEQDAASQAQFMSNELPRLMFVLLPIFALLLKTAFSDRLLFDHIVYSIHLHTAAYVVLAFMLPLERIADKHWLPLIAQVILLGYFLIYVVVSLRRVYHANWSVTTLKSVAILGAYLVVFSFAIESMSNLQILSD